MSNSKYVEYTRLSPNCSERTAPITKITIHHMAVVNGTLEGVGARFADRNSCASANYGIDSNGKVALYVPEDKRAWTSSNSENDNTAVTIEVANSAAGPDWPVSGKAYAKLIDLCVDICQRNGIKELVYNGTKYGTLTRHNMFTSTACPGPYLQARFPEIAEMVNRRLYADLEPTPTTGTLWRVQVGAYKVLANAIRTRDELKAKGQEASFEEILENVKERDYLDQHREVSPLVKAEDAILLDNSNMTIDQQNEWLMTKYQEVIEN